MKYALLIDELDLIYKSSDKIILNSMLYDDRMRD